MPEDPQPIPDQPTKATHPTPKIRHTGPLTFEWVSTKKLVEDSISLAGKLPADAVGIAGIPRSGMISAAVLATQLHLPLYELSEDGALNRLGHGSRGRHLGFGSGGGPLVVVDDTVYGGNAMRKARKAVADLGVKAVFAVVYNRLHELPEARGVADLSSRALASPHLLEWNLMNSGVLRGMAHHPSYGSGIALDFDGVICHDAESGGPPGSPYLLPRTHPVPLIATGRRERDRAATTKWMGQWGVRYDRLEMLPDEADETPENVARHKSMHYSQSGCGFFVESDPAQAELIAQYSKKPVICPREARVYQ